jgi:hypothetical protein
MILSLVRLVPPQRATASILTLKRRGVEIKMFIRD